MLNSTKTWQEEFDEEFLSSGEAKLYPTLPKGYWLNTATPYKIKQFISDLLQKEREIPYNVSEWKRIGIERGYWVYFKDEIRKRDEEELIKMIPSHDDMMDEGCLEAIDKFSKNLKDYYENN